MKVNNISANVGNFKFELRDIEVYPRMSEETEAFNADVYINGILVGDTDNDGRGGSNFVRANSEVNRGLVNELATELAKYHYHREPNDMCRYVCDWDYDLDFLIADMLYRATYYKEKVYNF